MACKQYSYPGDADEQRRRDRCRPRPAVDPPSHEWEHGKSYQQAG
jgi:hypothetical protein